MFVIKQKKKFFLLKIISFENFNLWLEKKIRMKKIKFKHYND